MIHTLTATLPLLKICIHWFLLYPFPFSVTSVEEVTMWHDRCSFDKNRDQFQSPVCGQALWQWCWHVLEVDTESTLEFRICFLACNVLFLEAKYCLGQLCSLEYYIVQCDVM